MGKLEFLQGLKAELEGRVSHSVIQENLNYYDAYIAEETARGHSEEAVIESLGGPRLIARTIVDAALNTEDRPDGFDSFGAGAGAGGGQDRTDRQDAYGGDRRFHSVDFRKWYVRLIAGLAVFLVIVLLMAVFFGIMGLAGLILSYSWPILLVLVVIWLFRGSRR